MNNKITLREVGAKLRWLDQTARQLLKKLKKVPSGGIDLQQLPEKLQILIALLHQIPEQRPKKDLRNFSDFETNLLAVVREKPFGVYIRLQQK